MTQDEIYDYVDNLSEEEFRACVMGALRRLQRIGRLVSLLGEDGQVYWAPAKNMSSLEPGENVDDESDFEGLDDD
jgi:hypothetical protein